MTESLVVEGDLVMWWSPGGAGWRIDNKELERIVIEHFGVEYEEMSFNRHVGPVRITIERIEEGEGLCTKMGGKDVSEFDSSIYPAVWEVRGGPEPGGVEYAWWELLEAIRCLELPWPFFDRKYVRRLLISVEGYVGDILEEKGDQDMGGSEERKAIGIAIRELVGLSQKERHSETEAMKLCAPQSIQKHRAVANAYEHAIQIVERALSGTALVGGEEGWEHKLLEVQDAQNLVRDLNVEIDHGWEFVEFLRKEYPTCHIMLLKRRPGDE